MKTVRATDQPELDELHSAFRELQKQTYKGVAGVAVIDSGKAGPTAGVSVCTHGNEPSGLAVYRHLSRQAKKAPFLTRGKIVFTLNNVRAAERFFAAKPEDRKKHRKTEVDMNRLPPDLRGEAYEVQRARELLPIWRMFDMALDIHSTSQKSDAMLIAGDTFDLSLVRGFPIERVISNIHNVQMGKPVFSFFGSKGALKTPVFGIEAGQHTDSTAFRCAIACVNALLQNAGLMLPNASGRNRASTFKEYFVADSIMFKDQATEFVRPFKNFGPVVRKGAVIARGNGATIKMPLEGHVLFGPAGRKPTDYDSEAAFITVPARTLRVAG